MRAREAEGGREGERRERKVIENFERERESSQRSGDFAVKIIAIK